MIHDAPAGRHSGFTLIELLVIVTIVGLLASIVIPNVLSAQRRNRYARSASDVAAATTQAVIYTIERKAYPQSIAAMRAAGLLSVGDVDPWGGPYQLSPTLQSGKAPKGGEEIHVFSKGPYGIGRYPNPFTSNTGPGGSVGYSSVYGAWTGF